MSFADLGGYPSLIDRLVNGDHLSSGEAEQVMSALFDGEATDAQTAALLIALKMNGETPSEIEGFVRAMLARTTHPEVPADTIDIVGTGGDRSGSVNVSTMASLVVAGAGVPVCKHGNRAASSQVGAADVLEALGVHIELDAAGVSACIEESNMGFCFAQRFHPAFRPLGPIRRELSIPTVFNILGPLANPARVTRQLIGVANPKVARTMVDVLAQLGSVRSTVVYADDGLDEISLTSSTTLEELELDQASRPVVTKRRLDPRDLGFELVHPAALVGGDLATNTSAVVNVLAATPGPHRNVVLLNAAAALIVAGKVESMEDGLALAAESIDSGSAQRVLDRLCATSLRLSRS